MTDTLYIRQDDILVALDKIREARPNKVVILGYLEWQIPQIDKNFVDTVKELGATLYVVHGCYLSDYHIETYEEAGLPIENVIFWGTAFFNFGNMHLSHKFNFRNLPPYKDFKHKFVSLNNRSHLHRCILIEELAKQNLLDKGIVTWIKHLNENSDFDFKYFNNEKRLLNDGFADRPDSYSIPIEYTDSLFDIVTEATMDKQFLTEKTVKPLLFKKPFVLFGAMNIHKHLVNLGFKLYDEVIDYSFDDIADPYLRAEMLTNNIHKILEMDSNELYELLLPKIVYNFHNAIRLMMDHSLIPDIVMDYYKSIGEPTNHEIYEFLKFDYPSVLVTTIWDDIGAEKVKNKLLSGNKNIDLVVIDNSVEGEYCRLNGSQTGVDDMIDLCNANNVPYVLLTCNYNQNVNRLRNSDANIIDSPGTWINKTMEATIAPPHRKENLRRGYDVLDNNVNLNTDISYLYTSFNNLCHIHRCILMDTLAKYNLIDRGAISWRDIHRHFDGDRNEIPDSIRMGYYQWKHWEPKRMKLDIDDEYKSNIFQAIIPEQLKHSFIHLVPESTHEWFFLTEKTGIALLYNKIFLVAGSKDYHKKLVDMGFKLFDNLFDYSFDSKDSMESRYEGLVRNIDLYRDKSMVELQVLLKENEEIIRHNRRVALDYALNKVPNDFKMVSAIIEGRGITNSFLPNMMMLERLKDSVF